MMKIIVICSPDNKPNRSAVLSESPAPPHLSVLEGLGGVLYHSSPSPETPVCSKGGVV